MSAALQPATPGDLGIPLREAPERFFDAATWREFLSYFEGPEAALRHISQPEPGILVFCRQRAAAQYVTPDGERARRDERAAELGRLLVTSFKERLIKEELIATALSPFNIDRARIPGERWPDLWPNFIENRADGNDLKFTDVRISQPTNTQTQDTDFLDRCIEWLRKRSEDGESRRKILLAEAIEHFGNALKTRTFNAAYKKVFSRTRGRPRKSRTGSNEPEPAHQGNGTHDPLRVEPRPGASVPQRSVSGMVKMVAPLGVTTVQTIIGRTLLVPPDRLIEVTEEEAIPLRAAGFVMAERPK